MDIDELAHALGVVFCRPPLGDLDLAPGSMHVEEDEQVSRSIAFILAVVTFEPARSGRDRLAYLTNELGRALVETDHRALGIGLFSIEVEHILHAGDVLAVDQRNAPHVLAPGLEAIFRQPPAHVSRETLSCSVRLTSLPASSSRVQRARPCGGLEQAVATSRASSLPESLRPAPGRGWRCLQVAEHEALLGPVDGRAANAHVGGDIVIAGPRIAGQQNLRSLELPRGVLTSAHKGGELGALGLAQFNPIAYIHQNACQSYYDPGFNLSKSLCSGTSPNFSRYLCTIEQACATICSVFCIRAALWRRVTRDWLGLFRGSAAKTRSRWAFDDAAFVTRCGAACQAGEPRAFAAALRRTAASHQEGAAGQPEAIAILMRRTLMRTSAPILSSLRRMVPQLALANGV